MGVTRTYVFPALRIVIWAVIAAALVKIAFTGAELEPADALQPTGEITESVVDVATGTITNAVTVPATVVADPPVEVKATAAGLVREVVTPDGPVAGKQVVITIRTETPRDPITTTDPVTGEQTVTERRPLVKTTEVTAPIGGTLDVTVLKDQQVSVGETIATIAPGTLSVRGQLSADQQYRLVGAAGEAQVTLKGGPAPFTCTGLKIGAAQQAGTDGTDPGAAEASTGVVSCAIPGDVTAFAGLGAEIEIVNGDAVDAVVVPVSAVLGSAEKGKVWVVATEGAEPEERDVVLGLTDGARIQVTEGLAAGDRILEFTPVPDGTEDGAIDCNDPLGYDAAFQAGNVAEYEKACFG